jgi:hypothetical protein
LPVSLLFQSAKLGAPSSPSAWAKASSYTAAQSPARPPSCRDWVSLRRRSGRVIGEIAREPPLARPDFAGNDDGLPDARLSEDDGLDLAELDAMAADLHLMIEASQELDLAVRAEPREVAGQIEPRPRRP